MLQVRVQPTPCITGEREGLNFWQYPSLPYLILQAKPKGQPALQGLEINTEEFSGLNPTLSSSLQWYNSLKWAVSFEEMAKCWNLSKGLNLPQNFFIFWDIPEEQQSGTGIKKSSWGCLAPWGLFSVPHLLPFIPWQHEGTLIRSQCFPGVFSVLWES